MKRKSPKQTVIPSATVIPSQTVIPSTTVIPSQTVIPSGSEGSPTNKLSFRAKRGISHECETRANVGHKSRGFSLIETLVAVTLFALTATLLVAAITNILRLSARFTLQRQINHETSNVLETISLETRLAMGEGSNRAIDIFKDTEDNDATYLQLRLAPTLFKDYVGLKTGDSQGIYGAVKLSDILYTGKDYRDPLDVMLVLDTSYSMNDLIDKDSTIKKIDALKEDAVAFVLKLQDMYNITNGNDYNLRVGFATYSTTAESPHPFAPLQAIRANLFVGIEEAVKSSGGGTNIAAGIEKAGNHLLEESMSRRVIILLSDGEANVAFCEPKLCIGESAKKAAIDMANTFRGRDGQAGITFYSIGLGSQATGLDEETLKTIAGNESRYIHAIGSVDLLEAFVNKIPSLVTRYRPGQITNNVMSSNQVDIKELTFTGQTDPTIGQPYVNMTLGVSTPVGAAPWEKYEAAFETVISSRAYKEAL